MNDPLLVRAKKLQLHGIIAHWEEVYESDWIKTVINWEETERSQRGFQRRLVSAHFKRFKPLSDFDWSWPKKCDRLAIEELMGLSFLENATNIILCGPNGVGKSTIVSNIAHQAVRQGHTALFTTAVHMLNDLASQDGDNALRRRIRYYSKPEVLVIDEVGYLSFSNRHADLLFAIISNRYEEKSTLITTNKPFSEWSDIFPNATSVVSLIDRLVHRSEIISIEAESFRLKEATAENLDRKKIRSKPTKKPTEKTGEKNEK